MTPEEASAAHKAQRQQKTQLKVCNFVMEIEVKPKAKPVTYETGVTCDIIDSTKAQRLGRIDENAEEDWENDFHDRFESVQRAVSSDLGRNVQRRTSHGGSMHHKEKQSNKICSKC